ncbi:Pentatricopeptide repeat-containing protein, chloroplastic [Ananas comosus]|uniref:Pentatricopeptide repeat-containing protein, chloroplastic n=1 Tax=Ananas comosus TaxID=4615 RepID=A0A199VNV7_ANACO|nr:Pentatricopeptide repeat-containing protein, chloroplastic [Ananas comosus]
MSRGYSRSDDPFRSISLFVAMVENGICPDDYSFPSVLKACAGAQAAEAGRQAHAFAVKCGVVDNIYVRPTLINMYAECGDLRAARVLFDGMDDQCVVSYNSMITASVRRSRPSAALALFREMQAKGIMPTDVTLLSVLSACTLLGALELGKWIHEYVKKNGFDSYSEGIKHYGCVIDLLARSGQLKKAYEFVDNLPVKPTPILWRTLLSACGGHGEVDIGKKVFERILELDDSHGGDYVIFSNMCANGGRWEEVNRIRKIMGERGVVKVPGCSSIEVDSTVHEFFSGDGMHPQSREARKMVDEMMEQLKLVGYLPNTSKVFHVDMGEEEKEASLRYHSEKLAIAFGLINTPPGTTIRVVKNLRVCGDCHSMAKLVSMVFNRRIILRDLNRFHHFDKGLCSCGEYW